MSGFLGGVVEAWREADAYAFKEKELIDRKLDTIVPQINESRLLQKELEKQAKRATQFYEKRLDGVLEGKEADAFLNAVNENPAKAIKVYEEITAAEKREGYAPISGEKLIAFYDFIEETKPEDMSREEWIEAGAKIATDPDIKNYDELLMALLASDDLDEVKSLSREFVPFQPPSLGFEAFDYSAINVLDPSFIKQAKTILIDSAIAEAASERNRFEEIKRERALTQEEQADFNEATNAFNNSKEEGSQETILGTPFGLAAFVRFVSVDNKFSKIPDARNYFPQFYDEDGKFIGIPDQ
tara:strand:- start:463 stop:1359 length:897 start_codon:yes stop_codon:yes gene_type:complete